MATISAAVDKWAIQLRKGCLELAILGCLWPERRYGLEMIRLLQTRANLAVTASTLYPLLARLKSDGLVKSEWVEAEEGHARKYYQITAAGRRVAIEMARVWSIFSSSLGSLLTDVLKETQP